MDIHIEPLISLHLERSLYTGHRERSLRRIAAHRSLHPGLDFAQTGYGILILLRIVIAWNPERCVIATHSEFRQFILDHEISQPLLLRELITETETIIEKTETYGHPFIGSSLHQIDSQFVIMVANLRLLAPYRLPCLIESASVNALHLEAVMERPARFLIHFLDILVPENQFLSLEHTTHFISEMTRPDDCRFPVIQ